ncbi:MAG: hypothetical protein NC310_05500 [Roseburia sp.]|nr:hypothetical protein [Anaeroplasma bactoclasticum]MCM1196515.1 hypothetical protein [Roseburia sp.]MCM1557248.1 hypothetical protein [Anaeroplasma bactoclasticum]
MKKKEKKSTEVSKKNQEEEKNHLFPFWGRLKFGKRRPTLVIDEEEVVHKKTKKKVPGYVHRETTHNKDKGYEEIKPNPDKTDPEPMYLKGARKTPKSLIKPLEEDFDMPEHLKKRYSKNNKK